MTPRIVALMGSGETSPTMVRTHRELLAQLGGDRARAVLLDTPFGFQENAGDITTRAVEYFRASVGHEIEVASLRSREATDAVAMATVADRIARADYVFAGPGSPSYALRQWDGTAVPELLREKLTGGGAVVFASAAALTLGAVTVPVYEIYKVGQEPTWLEGLDVLGAIGVRAAVIPHYDNAEGGTHDTRFCYLGERRLAQLETTLPTDVFVLGIDEHSVAVFDVVAQTVTVGGLGGVTVRSGGRSTEIPAGTSIEIAELDAMARQRGRASPPAAKPAPELAVPSATPLADAIAALERAFDAALARGDARAAVEALLSLDEELAGWSADTLQSDDVSRGRRALRSMVVRLGEVAGRGIDPRRAVAPFVDLLVELRTQARSDRRWADADLVRARLEAAGVEVRDTPESTEWGLLS